MESPAIERAVQHGAGGRIEPSGVGRLRELFRSPDSAKVFTEWRSNPTTTVVREAIRNLLICGAPGSDHQSNEIQYGVTCGLALAAQLMDDPSQVYPDVFSGKALTDPSKTFSETFSVGLDEALDNME